MTASIWAPNGFSPEVVPFDTFEAIAAGGQTVFSIAPYTAIYKNQLKVFKGSTATSGEILRTNQWDIVGTDIVLTSPCVGGEYVRVDVYSRNPSAGDELPDQTGNAGKYLQTNGTTPSWEDVPIGLPDQTGQSGKALFTDGTDPFWAGIPAELPTQSGNAGKVLSTNGTVPLWVASSSLYFNVESYGAVANPGIDAAPGFRAAAAAAESAGGGTVYVPAGKWFLKTADMSYEIAKDEYACVNFGSKVRLECAPGSEIVLDGAVLSTVAPFVAPATGRFNLFGIKRGAEYASIHGGLYTTNGWVLVLPFSTCNVVQNMGNYTHISDIVVKNMPGRNMITSGAVYALEAHPTFEVRPVGLRITNCHFINGAQNVPGNTLADDCSFIYVHGSDIKISGCTFTNDVDAVINCGGVELHSEASIVTGCYFNHLFPAVYTGVQDTTSLGAFKTTSTGNMIVGNTFVNNRGGIFLVSPHDSLVIEGNSFYRCWSTEFSVIGTTRLDLTGVSSGPQDGVLISNNRFVDVASGYKNQIRVAGFQDSKISGNIFDGGVESVNLLLASDAQTNNVTISDNTFTGFPAGGYSYATGCVAAAGYDGPSWSGNYSNIIVQDNSIVASTNVSANVGVLLLAGSVTYTSITNIRTRNNTVRNVYGGGYGTRIAAARIEGVWLPNPNPTIWFQTTGSPAVGNGSLQAVYMIEGNLCHVNFSLTMGSTTNFGANTSSYRFRLPVNSAATYFANGIPFQLMDKSANLTYTAWGGILAASDYVELGINAAGVRSDGPFVFAQDDVIASSFSYVIAP